MLAATVAPPGPPVRVPTETPLIVRALRGEPTPRRPVWLMRQAGRYLLDSVAGAPGVVANLGHGVIPGTPPENVAAFVDAVSRS